MNVIATLFAPMAEHGIDDQGYTSHHWLLPERAEIIYGGLASVIIIGLLVWKAGPLAKKAFNDRTAKVQAELDDSAQAKVDAEADTQAEALVADGRARLVAEVADLEAKADADIRAAGSRVSDELRSEISRLASVAADRVVADSLDDATQQRLIEDYIARVGASA